MSPDTCDDPRIWFQYLAINKLILFAFANGVLRIRLKLPAAF